MNKDILSIILYGSQARQDNDGLSDIDICLFTKNGRLKDINYEEIESVISNFQSNKTNLTVYPRAVVDLMLESGSLFLWHLKLEGKVVYGEKYFSSIINKLKFF